MGGRSAQSLALDERKLAAVGEGTPPTGKRQRAMENLKMPSPDDAMEEDVERSPSVENPKGVGGEREGDESSENEDLRQRLERYRRFWESLPEETPEEIEEYDEYEYEVCFSQSGQKRPISNKAFEIIALPDDCFTPLSDFKEDPQLYEQLIELAGDSVAYFNNLNGRLFAIQGIESVSSVEHDGIHYLLTIRAVDTSDSMAPKIVKAKVVDGRALDVEECLAVC